MTSPASATGLPFDQDLFDLLVCPATRHPLKFAGGQLLCTDAACRRAYRVDGDIPVMLIDESKVVAEPQWQAFIAGPGPIGAGIAAVQARAAAR